MAVTAHRFWYAKEFILSGSVNLIDDTLKIALLKPGFRYDNALVSYDELVALELDDSPNYQTGGALVTGKSVVTTLDGRAEFWINGLNFPYLTADVKTAILYASVSFGGISNPLLYYADFGETLEFVSTLFQFFWPTPIFRW